MKSYIIPGFLFFCLLIFAACNKNDKGIRFYGRVIEIGNSKPCANVVIAVSRSEKSCNFCEPYYKEYLNMTTNSNGEFEVYLPKTRKHHYTFELPASEKEKYYRELTTENLAIDGKTKNEVYHELKVAKVIPLKLRIVSNSNYRKKIETNSDMIYNYKLVQYFYSADTVIVTKYLRGIDAKLKYVYNEPQAAILKLGTINMVPSNTDTATYKLNIY